MKHEHTIFTYVQMYVGHKFTMQLCYGMLRVCVG